jgi:death-on-curing protein
MRYLTFGEVLELYRQVMEQSGGATGIRDVNALESALAQPQATYDSEDLYPAMTDKAAILCYLLIKNHPFLDGNKRIGHAAMEVFLLLNGYEIEAGVDEQEGAILSIAAGNLECNAFTIWLEQHVIPLARSP